MNSKEIISYFWRLRYEMIKYFVIGIATVTLDIGTLIFFKEWVKLSPVVAVSANQIIVIVFNFILNKYWVFKSSSLPVRQFVRYVILAAFNYSFSVFSMYLFQQLFGYNYLLVRFVTMTLASIWTFFLFKYWVYYARS